MEQKMPILDLRFAFFFANPPVNLKYDEFSVSLRKRPVFADNNLDLQTFIFPIPSDTPADFPRCQITSKDQNFELSITGARCDLFFKHENQVNITSIFLRIINEIKDLFEKENIEVTRIGYITRHVQIHNNPAKIIKEKLLKLDEPDLTDPFVRFVFRTEFHDILCNDNYQIEVGKQRDFINGKEHDVLLITQDFNTFPVENMIIKTDFLSYLNEIPKDKLNKYITLLSE